MSDTGSEILPSSRNLTRPSSRDARPGTVYRRAEKPAVLPPGPGLRLARAVYRQLPISHFWKWQLKDFLYKYVGFLVRNSVDYERWLRTRRERAALGETPTAGDFPIGEISLPVPQSKPLVSVVIPVFNRLGLTLRCLQSIANTLGRDDIEIIVVDDGSQDETPAVIPKVAHLRYLRIESNRGFIAASNLGAKNAIGRYLLFLNNDTQVVPGWLEELVNTFELIPEAGLVGSKLLYPDGRLQEAGGVIFRDGSGWNYGRNDDPEKPEYSYLREVDYVSGASILVPRDLFDQLGGFDTRYAPAYYEDTDLAFKVRALGRKVLYQPLSRVVHHEGGTAGTDLGRGVKSHQVVNAAKFFERWRETLKEHGTPTEHPGFSGERSSERRALFIDALTPTPDQDSGSMDTVQLMKMFLGFGFKVSFIPAQSLTHFGRYTADLQRIGVECLYVPYLRSIEDYLTSVGAEIDVVVLFRVDVASAHIDKVAELCPRAKIIFDTVDVHYIREAREAALTRAASVRRRAEKTRRLELDVIRKADATIVLSSTERSMLETELPRARIFHVPFARDMPQPSASKFADRRDILFVGSFRHPPNGDAVEYFLSGIWPEVKEKLPGVKFHVVGSNPPQELLSRVTDDVEMLGYVEDLSACLDRHRLSVAPLRYGAGTKGKIISSLSHGVPCVATPMATEGMGMTPGEHLLVATDPREFASRVVELYEDAELWHRLSEQGREFAMREYSTSAGRERTARVLAELGVSVERKNR